MSSNYSERVLPIFNFFHLNLNYNIDFVAYLVLWLKILNKTWWFCGHSKNMSILLFLTWKTWNMCTKYRDVKYRWEKSPKMTTTLTTGPISKCVQCSFDTFWFFIPKLKSDLFTLLCDLCFYFYVILCGIFQE